MQSQTSYRAKYKTFREAFPKRAMHILHDRLPSSWLMLTGFVLSAIFAGFMTVNYVPGLITDFKIWRLYKTDASIQSGGKCTQHKHIIIECSIRVNTLDGLSFEQQTLFFGATFPEAVHAVRSISRPELISTNIAIDSLSNRVWTLLLIDGSVIVFGLYCFFEAWNAYAVRRNLKQKTQLRPVLATITKMEGSTVKFTCFVEGRKRYRKNILREDEIPLLLDAEPMIALAVALPNLSHIMLIDQDFSCLDFSEEEQQKLLASIA